MEPISDAVLDHEPWSMTFVGGSADLVEQRNAHLQPAPASEIITGAQLPLTMTRAGDRVCVVQIKGGHRMVRRLTDLGITQGCEITVVSQTGSGSVIVATPQSEEPQTSKSCTKGLMAFLPLHNGML